MRFSDDCYNCRDCVVIDHKSYKRKLFKLVCSPIRFMQRLFVRDLEEREFKITCQMQKLEKFKHINIDAVNAHTFSNLEKYVSRMQNKINKLFVPDDFTEDFQFIFDLKLINCISFGRIRNRLHKHHTKKIKLVLNILK